VSKLVKPKIGAFEVKSDKPTQILDADCKRKSFLLVNKGDATIELLSSPHQKFGDGIPIAPQVPYDNDTATGAFWLIAESGTQNVRLEVDVEEQ